MLHNNNLQVNAPEVKDLSYEGLVRQGRVAAATCGMRLVGICSATLPWSGPVASFILAPQDGKEIQAL